MGRINRFLRGLALLLLALGMARAVSAQTAPVDPLLDKVTSLISGYLDQISDVKCTETVRQEKLSSNGHEERDLRATYDYLILLTGDQNGLTLNESRVPQKEPQVKKSQDALPMLLTNGFSNLFLIFHPYYRDSFRYEELGSEMVDGQELARIGFTHIPGTRTPIALAVRQREFPLSLTGTAWVDPKTGMIAKIDASLANDMHDVGLRAMKIEVVYKPVSLPGWNQAYRFPAMAKVDVETLKQHWRNIHEFENYKRFTVDSEATVSAKKEDQ